MFEVGSSKVLIILKLQTSNFKSAGLTGYLLHPVGMAAAFESGVHENIEHLFGIAVADKAGRYAKNVGVVMLAGQFGQFFAPADGGPDALVLVGRDGNTVGASAE